MILHVGKNKESGHYVAVMRDKTSQKWILYNDDQVRERGLKILQKDIVVVIEIHVQ